MKKLIALLFFTFHFSLFTLYAQDKPNPQDDNQVHTIVQQMPKFKGDLNKYLAEHIKYPEYERLANVTGTVYITFVVEKDGSITDARVLRGVANGPGLDSEALAVIKTLPNWNAGTQNGVPVRVQFNIPIHFELRDDNSPSNDSLHVYSITEVNKWPGYPAGDASTWVINKLKAKLKVNDAGEILTSFIIEKDGSLSGINIVSGVEAGINSQAVECISNMGKWNPGYIKGKPVRVKYYLKIKLNSETK